MGNRTVDHGAPRIVLVGGASSVGKTTAARDLARRLGADHLQVDDIRREVAETRVRSLEDPEAWRHADPGLLCDALRGAADALADPLADTIASTLRGDGRVILEGEGIAPGLAERYLSDARVRSVFIVELDHDRIAQTLSGRSGSFARLPVEQRVNVAEADARYGRWIRTECGRRGLAWVPSQPWATLAQRVGASIGAT